MLTLQGDSDVKNNVQDGTINLGTRKGLDLLSRLFQDGIIELEEGTCTTMNNVHGSLVNLYLQALKHHEQIRDSIVNLSKGARLTLNSTFQKLSSNHPPFAKNLRTK